MSSISPLQLLPIETTDGQQSCQNISNSSRKKGGVFQNSVCCEFLHIKIATALSIQRLGPNTITSMYLARYDDAITILAIL